VVLEDRVRKLGPVLPPLRFNSSICIGDQNDSIIALSRPFPSVPNDGRVQDWRGEITVPGDGCTRLRLQEATEPSDVRIDRSAGLGGRMLTPQPVHRQVDRDRQSNGAYGSDKVSTRSRQGRYSTIRARTAEGPARDVFSAGRITHGKGP
jgi:hypothetical protein